nr:hypothetical protein [Tanacetum cinerariifolium]
FLSTISIHHNSKKLPSELLGERPDLCDELELHLGDGEFVSHFAAYYFKSSFSLQKYTLRLTKGR